MSFLDTLEVFFDHSWVFRVDETKVASLFGVLSVKIEKKELFQRTYTFKDSSSGRLLFMVKRHTWKEANSIMDFITADKMTKIEKLSSRFLALPKMGPFFESSKKWAVAVNQIYNTTPKITKVESYFYPCSRSCCYWIGDNQITMILVNHKGIEFTALDCPIDKLIMTAKLFEEKKVF